MAKTWKIFYFLFIVTTYCNSVFASNDKRVSGKILSSKNRPVEFATLHNLTKNTSSISNSSGNFILEATIGDSVRIQHLNFETKTIVIEKSELTIILIEKDFLIEEVQVTPKAAFELFHTSCENTWKTFKEENIKRAYCQCVLKNGLVISKTANLDLDIVQKKLRSYKRGEKTTVYKIEEQIESDTIDWKGQFNYSLNLFYPHVQELYWVDLPNLFNYYKTEDENRIKLYLINKSAYDHNCKIEVIIRKKDTVLYSFGMIKKDIPVPILTKEDFLGRPRIVEDTIMVPRTYHYIEYKYTKEFGYLAEYVQGAVVQPQSVIEFSEHLKVYDNGGKELKKRRNRRKLFRNSFSFNLVKNRYENEFWLENSFPTFSPYNFEQLATLQPGCEIVNFVPAPE